MANQSQNGSGEPPLCANNCGFFGNPATNNLCSKCYKDFLMKQTKELGNTAPTIAKKGGEQTEKSLEQIEGEASVQQVVNVSMESSSLENPENRPPKRCSLCRKRVGLTGFKCCCGQTFSLCIDILISTTVCSTTRLLGKMQLQGPILLSKIIRLRRYKDSGCSSAISAFSLEDFS